MKRLYTFVTAVLSYAFVNAQNIGIGTNTPNASAILEINSSNKGVLLPRLADTSSVSSPAKGLAIYNNSDNKLWYYDGSRWQQAAANAGGMDSIWYKTRDTVVYTGKRYVGINADYNLISPQATLEVNGSFLVQGKLAYSTANPTVGQTFTMNNTPTIQNISNTDSVFRIYDPGGTANYNNNMQGNVSVINGAYDGGVKISSVAADFGIGAGDTLWIGYRTYPECKTEYVFRFTNTTINPDDIILPRSNTNISFVFRSNADGNNNKGFNFKVTRLFSSGIDKHIVTAGPSVYFNGNDGSFAAGSSVIATNGAVVVGNMSRATNSYAAALGTFARASGVFSLAAGYSEASGYLSTAVGQGYYYPNTASADYSVALGFGNFATANNSVAMGNSNIASGSDANAIGQANNASGIVATAIGTGNNASGNRSLAFGYFNTAKAYQSSTIGCYNDTTTFVSSSTWVSTDPLLIVGNGQNHNTRSNAMMILKNGNVGIGTNTPAADLHIRHAGGGGILLENTNDGNKWRIYSASGDNHLTFYNNIGTEIADIDDATGTFNALSDIRFKKDIQNIQPVLPLVMQLRPAYYHFKWQEPTEQLQLGMLAQEAYKLFPELVSYNKATDVYKMNYAGFSTVAIKAIQEQQMQIQRQQKQIDELTALVRQLLNK